MSTVQKQINDLSDKFHRLQEIVVQLSEQVAILSAEQESASTKKGNEEINVNSLEPIISSEPLYDVSCSSMIDHKDILNDRDNGSKTEDYAYHSEAYVPPEIQIRRLTAQLTAAYNRIAVLEEQLLARRIHH